MVDFVQDTLATVRKVEEDSKDEDGSKLSQWGALMNGRYFTGESVKQIYLHCSVMDLAYDGWGRAVARGGMAEEDMPPQPWSVYERVRVKHHMLATSTALVERKAALTENHFVAIVPKAVKVGDSIWALAGGQVLYLLRYADPGRNQYKFIGEIYVHGLMDGEISEGLQEGRIKLHQISLV